MKKSLILLLMLNSCKLDRADKNMKKLESAPGNIEQYFEIAAQYNEKLPDLWNSLKPEERIFAYYMYRASIPGNRIHAGQTHRHAQDITDIFEKIVLNKEILRDKFKTKNNINFNIDKFINQSELFLVYLFAHHGQYLIKEFENHKRTPEKLNLTEITETNLIKVLTELNINNAQELINKLHDSIFKTEHEHTVTVEGDIEKSAGNYYSPDFKEDDYQKLTPEQKSAINAYFEIDKSNGKREIKVTYHKIGGNFSKELEVAHYWLTKARDFSKLHQDIFDKNIPNSLEHMLKYLESGNEQDFKNFCIEWIRTNSKIDFNFGFVEVYQDPKQYRGSFEADITIKCLDMQKLNKLFPILEDQLPFEAQFKRQNLSDVNAIPNASVNAKLFGSGDAGPIKFTAAYCLPNYDEIRSVHGSKQIIYQHDKGIGELLNPDLNRKLFNIKLNQEWLNNFDPQNKLDGELSDILTTLHETIGHASGRFSLHKFVEGDPLIISGQKYNIGDILQVTSDNVNEFIGGYMSGLEELRAEIIALYISVFCFDELNKNNVFKDWPQKLSKEIIIEKLILHMAKSGLYRLISQNEDAKEISQAHARANTTILNYLLDHGGLKLVEEKVLVNNQEHTVIDLKISGLDQAKSAVKDLTQEVQRIKSTADGLACDNLMKTYGICIRKPEYIKFFKANRKAVMGDLKEVADIFPQLSPVFDNNKNIIDINAKWPESFLSAQLELSRLALSKE